MSNGFAMADPATAAFQIRDFPIALREEIVRAAKEADMTVADFVAGICLQAREAGWIRATPLRANGLTNTQDAEIANLCRLTEAACKLAEYRERMPKRIAGRLGAAIRAALPPVRRLPAPASVGEGDPPC